MHYRKSVRTHASREYRSSILGVGSQSPRIFFGSHVDASHSRQPLVKGERLVRYEVNAVILLKWVTSFFQKEIDISLSPKTMRDYVEDLKPGTVGSQLLLAKNSRCLLHARYLLEEARKLTSSKEILPWMTPSEAPKALQASECSELLDPMRASCWIFAQH